MGNGDADAGLKLRMRSEERRISSQHRQLEELFDRVLESLSVGGARRAVNDFLLFSTALEAHMSVEEDIYFPALHGLRNDVGGELEELIQDHEKLRRQLDQLRQVLASDRKAESDTLLDELARDIDRHELVEEELIARIAEGPVAGLGHTSLEP